MARAFYFLSVQQGQDYESVMYRQNFCLLCSVSHVFHDIFGWEEGDGLRMIDGIMTSNIIALEHLSSQSNKGGLMILTDSIMHSYVMSFLALCKKSGITTASLMLSYELRDHDLQHHV